MRARAQIQIFIESGRKPVVIAARASITLRVNELTQGHVYCVFLRVVFYRPTINILFTSTVSLRARVYDIINYCVRRGDPSLS